MNPVQTLLDRAIHVCKGQAELARRLGTKPPAITEMKKGRRAITPDTALLLAEITGDDPIQAMIDARILQPGASANDARIRDILGKGRAAGEAAVSLLCYLAASIPAMVLAANHLTPLYIVSGGRSANRKKLSAHRDIRQLATT